MKYPNASREVGWQWVFPATRGISTCDTRLKSMTQSDIVLCVIDCCTQRACPHSESMPNQPIVTQRPGPCAQVAFACVTEWQTAASLGYAMGDSSESATHLDCAEGRKRRQSCSDEANYINFRSSGLDLPRHQYNHRLRLTDLPVSTISIGLSGFSRGSREPGNGL